MAYQPLARKYRPQRFAELIGQDATAAALTNSIKLNRPISSLIFTGVRGVGKTTSARLYAKALNCESGPTAEPCGSCDGCASIAQGTHPDVIEVDGASHNGVDEVRLLQETLEYVPQRAAFKVYIIDEVHMLSQSAFNALLKTLEEPPNHVVFIFATTEIQRVPRTIISRCQVYHLNKFSLNYIVEQLQFILNQEKISFDEAGLRLIAREGKGSMRDALTMLDQVIVRGHGSIVKQNVMDILRLASGSEWIALLEALLNKESSQILLLLDGYDAKGLSYIQVVEGLASYTRAAFILRESKSSASVNQLLDMEGEEIEALSKIAKQAPVFELNRLFRTFIKCRSDLDGGEMDRYIVENYCFEWCLDPGLPENFVNPDGKNDSLTLPSRVQSEKLHLQNHQEQIKPASDTPALPNTQSVGAEPSKNRNLKSLWKAQLEQDRGGEHRPDVENSSVPPANPVLVLDKLENRELPTQISEVVQQRADPPTGVEISGSKGFPKSWRDLVEQWKIQKPLQARLLEEAYLVSYDPKLIRVSIRPASMVAQKLMQAEIQKKIETQLHEMFGFTGRFQVEEISGQSELSNATSSSEAIKQTNLLDIKREERREAREHLINNVKEHPLTKEALSLFNGTIESIEVIDG